MKESKHSLLRNLSSKYIWWKKPDEAIKTPGRVIAQVMNIGEYEDVRKLVKCVGHDELCGVLTNAEIGQFNERSWVYWHYKLGLAKLDQIPPMPIRRLND